MMDLRENDIALITTYHIRSCKKKCCVVEYYS